MGLAAAATAVGTFVTGGLLTGVGAGILGGGLFGAGLGAIEEAATGGNIGLGALAGGVTGGLIPAGGALGGALGGATGAAIGDVAGGLAGGALGGEIQGGNPLLGALEGGAAGGIAALGSPNAPVSSGGSGGPGSAGGGGLGAGEVAPIPGVAANPDLTQLASAAGTTPVVSDASSGTSVASPDLAAAQTLASGSFGGGGSNLGSLVDAASGIGSATGGAAPALTSGGGFDASGQLQGLTPDVAGGTVSGGATGASATPVSGANIAGGAGSGSQSLLDRLVSGGESSLTKNPLGTLIAGGGLLTNLVTGQKKDPNQTALGNQAAALNAEIGQLETPLTTGVLPAGAQAAVTQGVASAKAAIRAKYASLGLSGSTMETQDLAQIDLKQSADTFSLASQLYNQGIQGAELSTQIYNDLLSANTAQNQQTGQAISNLAAALNGGGGTTIKLAA